MRQRMRQRADEPGFALVAAMWGAALLAIIALSVLELARAEARLGRGGEDVAQLGAVADAAVNLTILAMLGPAASRPPVDATPFPVAFAGRDIAVRVTDESGKIDINLAGSATLTPLLVAAGLEPDPARELARRILAWRGESAEPAVRRATPFQSAAGLQRVPGVTPALWARLAPFVTVYSGSPYVDPAYASVPMLQVFQQLDPGAAAALRRIDEERNGVRQAGPRPGVVPGHSFTIRARATGPAATRAERMAVIRITGQPLAPLLIYEWR